jgi:hypothetical protein
MQTIVRARVRPRASADMFDAQCPERACPERACPERALSLFKIVDRRQYIPGTALRNGPARLDRVPSFAPTSFATSARQNVIRADAKKLGATKIKFREET